jgi:hypothetical protein
MLADEPTETSIIMVLSGHRLVLSKGEKKYLQMPPN